MNVGKINGFQAFKQLVESRMLKDELDKINKRKCIKLLLKNDVSADEYKELINHLKSFSSITDVFEVEAGEAEIIEDDEDVVKEEIEYFRVTSTKGQ